MPAERRQANSGGQKMYCVYRQFSHKTASFVWQSMEKMPELYNTVQVDRQHRDKRRDIRKCTETLTASGVGVIQDSCHVERSAVTVHAERG